jgi:DNA-binding Lrp family transcriptional regulator
MAVNASSFEDEKPGGIQVIARAAAILNVLGKHPGGMSLGEIAQEVALPRSTVQRIVAALDSAQLVRSSGAGGLRLGPALLKLISSVHSDVVDLVRPFLERLSFRTVSHRFPRGDLRHVKRCHQCALLALSCHRQLSNSQDISASQ